MVGAPRLCSAPGLRVQRQLRSSPWHLLVFSGRGRVGFGDPLPLALESGGSRVWLSGRALAEGSLTCGVRASVGPSPRAALAPGTAQAQPSDGFWQEPGYEAASWCLFNLALSGMIFQHLTKHWHQCRRGLAAQRTRPPVPRALTPSLGSSINTLEPGSGLRGWCGSEHRLCASVSPSAEAGGETSPGDGAARVNCSTPEDCLMQ